MTTEEVLDALKPWRDRMRRQGWKPVTSESGDGRSHFGGDPVMAEGEAWPACEECQKPMRLLVQLDLSGVPPEADVPVREGLLQVFYCQTDDGMCSTWEPFAGCNLVRVADGAGAVARPDGVEPFQRLTIDGWTPIEDDPHPEDQELNGLTYQYDFDAGTVALECDDPAVKLEGIPIGSDIAEAIGEPEAGDKLGGWPMWVQGAEYPDCPECGTAMRYVFQIDSEDNVDHMFGDVGCGHVTYCPKHQDVLAFGWACG